MKKKKRIAALLMAGMVLFSTVPLNILASEREDNKGLCEHHQHHTAECGYTEGKEAASCSHEHTEDCYKTVERCIHEHTSECYPDSDGTEIPNEGDSEQNLPEEQGESSSTDTGEGEGLLLLSDTTEAEPTACTHVCSVENGCITEELDCPHERGEHTADCGYAEEIPAQSCNFVCEVCGGTEAEWPEAPPMSNEPTDLPDGEIADGMYGKPTEPINTAQLASMQKLSAQAPVAEDPEREITEDEVNHIVFIYVNGEAYKGGEITVTEGDNFSYDVFWAPKVEGEDPKMEWGEGSWFEATLFKVPGLNLASPKNIPMNIGGVKVGEYSLTYDKKTGEMKYKVVFNRYIQFFDPKTVVAQVQGSGKFIDKNVTGPIEEGGKKGTLTIQPRPEIPQINLPDVGTGWKPPEPPKFDNDVYPVGKGVKWDSSGDPNRVPQIEWRITFLEQIQKIQQDFKEASDKEGWKAEESEGYIIIEETLDANQQFYHPENESNEYGDAEAPFYMELPVLIPGTDHILNGSTWGGGQGDGNYDGPGIINTRFNDFEEIDGSGATTAEEIKNVQEKVKATPLSYTVTTDPSTRRQTLLVNAGKLGADAPSKGITWQKAVGETSWPVEGLKNKIEECQNNITAVENGGNSPIALLKQRATTLNNLLERAVEMKENAAKKDEYEKALEHWQKDYEKWRDDKRVDNLTPLTDQNGDLICPLPKKALLESLLDCRVSPTIPDRTIKDTQEYQNYLLSLDNIQKDQATYLKNRTEYGEAWENVKKYYEDALTFYQKTAGVYGFVMKVRTKSVNTSMTEYSNSVNIELDDKDWKADDTTSVQFAGGIIGNYSLGDVVVQKADAYYHTEDGNAEDEIQKVEKDKAGLAGAEFQMYCGNSEAPDKVPELDHTNLAHFLDKDASMNGKTYLYTHTGKEGHGGVLLGEVTELKVDENGKLALGSITPNHSHWLVETKAPAGYYLDDTPIKIESEQNKVNYMLRPNVSRSVLLQKVDSFSNNPVEGAEFTLYRTEDGTETEVTGFTEKNLNGHQTYWADGTGSSKLKTNADGDLCIHGLAAGSYVLKETNPAPGYLTPEKMPEYKFTLKENLPQNADADDYDENYHYLLTTKAAPLKNDPDVAKLTMNKTGIGNNGLKDAGFALFRFTGTEAQWEENPDNEEYWKAVSLTDESDQYFDTTNIVNEITIRDENAGGGSQWAGKDLDAVMTDNKGTFTITKIPIGHYSVSEVEAPDEYKRDFRSFYFTVDGETVDTDLKLYTEPQQKNELKDNTLKNYQQQAQLALVKYDAAAEKPKVDGEELKNGGYRYTENVLKEGSPSGLEGAVYKLFMRRGASTGQTNPYPGELKDAEKIVGYKPGYDTCVAMGTTDGKGVLKLSDMRGSNSTQIQGLNPEEYYMIEVKAPDGYILDQTAIHFSLHGEIFDNEDNEDNFIPGLVMTAPNNKAEYGIRLTKVGKKTTWENKDNKPVTENPGEAASFAENPTEENPQELEQTVGLRGAEFTVRLKDEKLYFTFEEEGKYRLAEGTEGATDKVVTGEDGKLTITGLKAGTTYTLTETKPPHGYKLPKEPTVEITTPSSLNDGKLEEDILFPKKDAVVTNEQLLGKVSLHKRAAETNEPLAGAEFTLYETIVTQIPPGDPNYDPANPNATRSKDIKRAVETTDEDGNLTFENLPWSDFYYIQETKAPEGYLLDQTKRSFQVNELSFNGNGEVIEVSYPAVSNSKGTLGVALLKKTDAEDHEQGLQEAHFFLEKKMGTDATGKEIWTGYGKGIYITDVDGEIRFLLPPGDYRLTEMAAPPGYILDASKEISFTIEDTPDGSEPETVIIDEKDSDDGVITNKKGDLGVYIKKVIEGTTVPIPGVTFQLYWEHLIASETEELYFVDKGNGNYEYAENINVPEVTHDLITNENGEIYIILPKSFKNGSPNYPDDLSTLMYREVAVPDGVQLPVEDKRTGEIGTLTENIYEEISVKNQLKPDPDHPLAIQINKTDGKSKQGLAGAEFELFTILNLGSEKPEVVLAKGITDKNGNLTFDKTTTNIQGAPLELMPGISYYIRETKAPEGYVLDQTVHQVVIDREDFDENFTFQGITLSLHNYRIKGSVELKKVSAEDYAKGLPGAEFELLRKEEYEQDSAVQTEWAHYGEERYITDENGQLVIADLPYGTYKLVERAAPLGYLLDDPAWEEEFSIETEGQAINLGNIINKVDPNPVRDVRVKKVAAEDNGKVLQGAEFRLYEMKEDGNYYPVQSQTYVTDSDGEFVIKDLPVGSYALKELKAPAGYDVPDQDMTYFVVRVDERFVELQIENARFDDGDGGEHGGSGGNGNNGGNVDEDGDYNSGETPGVSVTVKKVWDDNDNSERPESVRVQLYRNGLPYGDPVQLSEQNDWKHVWRSLDNDDSWFVDEPEVPTGYEKQLSHRGNRWTITNTMEQEIAAEPQPTLPDSEEKPTVPGNSEKPIDRAPWTGDSTRLSLWVALMCLSALGFGWIWRRSGTDKK